MGVVGEVESGAGGVLGDAGGESRIGGGIEVVEASWRGTLWLDPETEYWGEQSGMEAEEENWGVGGVEDVEGGGPSVGAACTC